MRAGNGVVYTETVVWSAPAHLMDEAPYQIAIITLDSGGRVTGRIEGERVSVGDRVQFVESRNQVPVFRKQA
ncbi:MAG: OB-fold domain-containing protein [Bryobacteraceae bacterium]|nr:OB-fold domain-containing protein [Bryobacteraceae bacterium]